MMCQKCKKRQATLLYKQTINGVTEESALCPECAQEMSIGSFFSDDFNLFGSLFDSRSSRESGARVCDLCGSTFEQIARDGKVGCARCYEIFADRLRPSIERIHGNSRHVGKRPAAAPPDPKAEKLAELKKELEQAIAEEKYEQAAILRDRIKEMEA